MKEGVAFYRAVDNGNDFEFVALNDAGLSFGNKKREDVIGERVTEVFPSVEAIGLLDVLRRVYKTGRPEQHPLTRYRDKHIEEWVENYVFTLPSGLLVAVYEDTTEKHITGKKYRKLLESLIDGFSVADTQGRLLDVNEAYCRMSGYSREELLSMSILQLEADENSAEIQSQIEKVIREGSDSFERTYKRKDGTLFTVDVRADYLPSEGHFIVFIRDITDRKQVEEEANKAKRFLDTISDIAYEADTHGNITYVNPAVEKITGFTMEEIIGKPFLPLFIKEDHASLMDVYKRTLQGESLENTLIFINGATCHFTTLPKYNAEGNIIGTFGVARDITEYRETQQTLHINLERYRKAQELGKVGNWEYNIQTTEFWGSEQAKEIYGFDLDSTHFTTEEVESCIPERQRVHRALIDLIEKNKPYDLEFEIITHDTGELKTIISVAELEKDSQGNPLKINGVIQDVTVQKRAEKELLEQREILQNIIDKAHTHLVYLDTDFNFVAVNFSYAETCNRTPEELLGKNHFYFYPHKENEKIFKQVRDIGQSVSFKDKPFEFPDQPERGITYWDWTLSPVYNDKNIISGLVFSLVETTERKRAEQQKDFLMKELNHRVKNNLAMISSLIALKAESLGPDVDLSDISSQIDAIKIVHEKLYKTENMTHIDLKEYIQELLSTVFSLNTTSVIIENNIDSIFIPTQTAVTIGLIINELATNAIKHGFTDQEAGFAVNLEKDNVQKQYILIVSNTGNPFPDNINLDNPKTLGLRLIEALVSQIDGTIKLMREPCPEFTIRFSIEEYT